MIFLQIFTVFVVVFGYFMLSVSENVKTVNSLFFPSIVTNEISGTITENYNSANVSTTEHFKRNQSRLEKLKIETTEVSSVRDETVSTASTSPEFVAKQKETGLGERVTFFLTVGAAVSGALIIGIVIISIVIFRRRKRDKKERMKEKAMESQEEKVSTLVVERNPSTNLSSSDRETSERMESARSISLSSMRKMLSAKKRESFKQIIEACISSLRAHEEPSLRSAKEVSQRQSKKESSPKKFKQEINPSAKKSSSTGKREERSTTKSTLTSSEKTERASIVNERDRAGKVISEKK